MELLADHPAAGIKLVRGHVGDLQQHRRHQVHALQQLQVDVHVEGHLPGSAVPRQEDAAILLFKGPVYVQFYKLFFFN